VRFFSRSQNSLSILWVILVAGCGGGERVGGGNGPSVGDASERVGGAPEASPEVWELSDSPLVEIGVREGEDPYQLHRVRGSVLLEDGRIVVLNAGSQELRFYDPHGRYLMAVGNRGEGPGEFGAPAGLRRTAEGGLQVWDGSLMRLSIFDTAGRFEESVRLMASREEMFPGDDWLMGQNWIVSPVPPGARDPIRRAVESISPPDSIGVLRTLWVTPQGRIWSPRERPPADRPVEWDVYDLQGRQVARITTPARFQPHEIGEEHVTGLFLDDMDVNYVRVYGVVKPSGSPPGPGLDFTGSRAPQEMDSALPPPSEEVLAEIRSLVKNLASLQEIHYAGHYTYTSDVDALFADPRSRVPDGLAVDILFAGTEGWAGMVTHPESGGRCVLAYGFFVPMGWQPGSVICL
jgi:hypothetical protein